MSALADRRPPLALARAIGALAVLLTGAAAAFASWGARTSGDFQLHGPVSGDNSGPALVALAHGHLGSFASHQPLMGLTSLLLRAPVVAVTSAAGASDMTVYRLTVIACLLPCALFAAWLIVREWDGPSDVLAGSLAAAVILLAPATGNAISSGHPEELLAATALTAATLAAVRGRAGWAGLLLGVAIGTKEWTAIGLLPIMIALDAGRLRALAGAAVAALALVAPPLLADPPAFAAASRSFGDGHLVGAISAWWPLGSRPPDLPAAAPLVAVLPWGLTKSAALALGVGAGCAAVAALWRIASARRVRLDPLALLIALALVRCVVDPGPVEYYYVAVLVPLAAWETVTLRRLPLVSLLAVAAVSFTFGPGLKLTPSALSLISLSWALALVAYLLLGALRAPASSPHPSRR